MCEICAAVPGYGWSFLELEIPWRSLFRPPFMFRRGLLFVSSAGRSQ